MAISWCIYILVHLCSEWCTKSKGWTLSLLQKKKKKEEFCSCFRGEYHYSYLQKAINPSTIRNMTATSLETSINTPRSQPAGRGNYALLMTEALLVDENNHSWVSVIVALGCQEYHAQWAQTWLQPGSPHITAWPISQLSLDPAQASHHAKATGIFLQKKSFCPGLRIHIFFCLSPQYFNYCQKVQQNY